MSEVIKENSITEEEKQALITNFKHRSLKERAEEYDGELNLTGEVVGWGEPVGREQF